MSVDAQKLAEDAVRMLFDSDRATQALGARICAVEPGQVRVAMHVSERMLNGHATCHGGFIFALADSAFAFACNSHNERNMAASAAIDFLAPAQLGDELYAEARELWRSRRQGIYEVTVANGEGVKVALFRGRSHRVDGQVVAPDATAV